MTGDEMGINGKMQHPQPFFQRVFPNRDIPFNEKFPTPDVINQNIELSLFFSNTINQGLDLCGDEMIGGNGNSMSSGSSDEIGCVFNGFNTIVF